MQDFEVVGLLSSSNGRCCTLHECCGEEVEVGDILRLVACTVSVDGAVEEAIKVVKVVDGVDQCTVGFVPRVPMSLPAVKNQVNKFVQVSELYHDSNNTYKKDKSYKNCGMARVSILDEEGQKE
eukprot:scaffold8374_cov175-Amphora_coffeaeformis.AAC.125